ncbi:YheC/YheD family endospore coat-associated protein [Paenibacillus silviterrae]|uniref:YheC/YheD family endospore coat-associated protein n=1 Tax=Paenibacillus silviterrae TaxID=3242194 RepID=UPI002543155C|nr:YheC/YheD family protein [Paenibacillus chinjuensis]
MMITMLERTNGRTLGIMTTRTEGDVPFTNRGFYRRLIVCGRRYGLTVFVFSPEDIDWSLSRVTGYVYEPSLKQWVSRWFPLPDAVYDRCFFSTRKEYANYRTALRRLLEQQPVRLLGYGLKGKWEVQQLLQREERLRPFLPPTEELRSSRTMLEWLKRRDAIVLKPQGGSQGRGVLLVRRESAGMARVSAAAVTENTAEAAFSVRGRDARNRRVAHGFGDAAALLRWLRRFTGRRSYLVQPYLQLHDASGDAYDVRSLVQKDGAGRWQLTGMAVRQGQGGSLTSNLHGGGKAEAAGPFLARVFGPEKARQLQKELTRLSELIPDVLESCHGRLVELGIDFGVDLDGYIWILEVNSKPGRSIFTYLQDDKARNRALENPIRYAKYLLTQTAIPEDRKLRRFGQSQER